MFSDRLTDRIHRKFCTHGRKEVTRVIQLLAVVRLCLIKVFHTIFNPNLTINEDFKILGSVREGPPLCNFLKFLS